MGKHSYLQNALFSHEVWRQLQNVLFFSLNFQGKSEQSDTGKIKFMLTVVKVMSSLQMIMYSGKVSRDSAVYYWHHFQKSVRWRKHASEPVSSFEARVSLLNLRLWHSFRLCLYRNLALCVEHVVNSRAISLASLRSFSLFFCLFCLQLRREVGASWWKKWCKNIVNTKWQS